MLVLFYIEEFYCSLSIHSSWGSYIATGNSTGHYTIYRRFWEYSSAPYPRVIRSKTYRGYVKPRIIPNAIQSDSGGICNTLGNDSMCDSKQKSSYEHGYDFERLPRYRVPCNAFTIALRLVAASLKICYEMCQTSTRQGFVHCRSLVPQWWVTACMWY
jgi:hypothetical protein